MARETTGNISDFDLVICPFGFTVYFNIQNSVVFYPLHVLTVLSIISAIFTLILNTLVMTTILKSSVLWSKLYYKGLLYMSVTDFLTGAISFPVFVFYCWSLLARKQDSEDACSFAYILAIVGITLYGFSANGAVFLTVERFLKVCCANKYNTVVTKGKAVSLMMVLCAISFTSVVICITTNSFATTNIYSFVYASIYMIIIPSLYYKIFKTVRESRARVGDEQTDRNIAGRLREQKLAKKFSVIIICFVVCLTPYCVLNLFMSHEFTGETEFVLSWYFSYLLLSNSLFNPIIYIWQDSVMRKELVEMLKWRKTRIDVGRVEMNNP